MRTIDDSSGATIDVAMDWRPLGVTPEHGIVPKQRRAETKSSNKQQLTSNKKAQIDHNDSCNGLGVMGKKQQSTSKQQPYQNEIRSLLFPASWQG